MLSLQKCRALLGPVNVKDEELEELRDQLYSLAHIFIESYLKKDESEQETSRPNTG